MKKFSAIVLGLAMFLTHCDTHASYDYAVANYAPPELATYIVERCQTSKNPTGCVKFGVAIGRFETMFCTTGQKKTNNCWGLEGHAFGSKEEAFDAWVGKYDKYWWRHKTPEDFVKKSGYNKVRAKRWLRGINSIILSYKNYE